MLHETHYVRSFEYALQADHSAELTVKIDSETRPSGEHPQRYNIPEFNEFAITLRGE